MGENRVIGLQNDMPWHLPKDLAYFKKVTTGHTVVMGRRTYESIGRPLPNRRNVVVTRKESPNLPAEVEVLRDLNTVLQWEKENPQEEIFIAGGGQLYEQMIPHADRLYITKISSNFEGDTYFPEIDKENWEIVSETFEKKDENHPFDLTFIVYERRKYNR